jgi:hypothetical protein
VPAKREDYFTLPAGFVMNGWLQVLEDSEITLLLMVPCGRGTLVATSEADMAPGEVAIPAEVRLRRYGIHRDPFSAARKTVEWFGLLDVREVARHFDGRREDIHRLCDTARIRGERCGHVARSDRAPAEPALPVAAVFSGPRSPLSLSVAMAVHIEGDGHLAVAQYLHGHPRVDI